MAPEKVTEMILNVDLKCAGCYKKVKKVICKIPQVRIQVFDVEKNRVLITVVCCNPEKIRDKLCYKGGGAIQSIEIIEKPGKPTSVGKPMDAEKPKPADKPKDADKPKPVDAKPADKPKDAGKPKEPEKAKPKDGDKPKVADKPPKEAPKGEAPKKPDGPSPDVAKMMYEPVHGYPQMYPSTYPMMGYGQYYDGYGGGLFQHGYGMPVAPPPPPPPPPSTYYGYGYENRNSYTNNDHYSDNDAGCSIM